jgi:hypothetical protein
MQALCVLSHHNWAHASSVGLLTHVLCTCMAQQESRVGIGDTASQHELIFWHMQTAGFDPEPRSMNVIESADVGCGSGVRDGSLINGCQQLAQLSRCRHQQMIALSAAPIRGFGTAALPPSLRWILAVALLKHHAEQSCGVFVWHAFVCVQQLLTLCLHACVPRDHRSALGYC